MEPRCEVCGQLLPHRVVPEAELPPQEDQPTPTTTDLTSSVGPSEPPVRPAGADPAGRPARGKDRKILAVLGALGALWLAVVGLAQLASPDEVAEVPVRPTATPVVPTATPVPPTPAPTPTPELEVPPAQVDISQLGSRSGVAVQMERVMRQVGRRGVELALVYRAAEGVVVVNLAEGAAEVIAVEETGAQSPQFVVLRHDNDQDSPRYTVDLAPDETIYSVNGEVYALSPRTGEPRLIAKDGSLIAARSASGAMHWVPGRELQAPRAEVLSVRDEAAAWYPAPLSHRIALFDGLGVIAIDDRLDGGTQILGLDGFEPLTPHRVITASVGGVLTEDCQANSTCRYEVQPSDPDVAPWIVPADFVGVGDRLALAPDAKSLLRMTQFGFGEVYGSDGAVRSWIANSGMADAVWGPDASFIAWIDQLARPELRMAFVDERDWLNLDLDQLGLPRPVSTEIALLGLIDRPES